MTDRRRIELPRVIERMIKNGCKIYNSSKELPERILKQWTSTEEWLKLSEARALRSWQSQMLLAVRSP